MPYYAWTALDITGVTHRGTFFANNTNDLEAKLYAQQLGLIKAKETYSFAKLILPKKDIAQAIKDIAHLLQAQVQLYQSCALVASMQKNVYLKSVLTECAQSIYQGSSLDQALAWHTDIISFTLQGLIKAGQETGKLPQTLDKIAKHQLTTDQLKRQLGSLLLMPCITFVSFILLVIVFLTLIIPRFELFFASFDKDLPALTVFLIQVSHKVQNITVLHIVFTTVLFLLIGTACARWGKNQFFSLLLKLPIGSLIITWNLAHVLQLLAILVSGGIPLVSALALAANSISNKTIAQDLFAVEKSVTQGMQITQACKKSKFFAQGDLQAILSLGESTAELAAMLEQAATIYQTRAYIQIKRIVSISQPISLMILGSLIAGLLYCLYVPIFSVSQVIM